MTEVERLAAAIAAQQAQIDALIEWVTSDDHAPLETPTGRKAQIRRLLETTEADLSRDELLGFLREALRD
jgi:hypothetical protein